MFSKFLYDGHKMDILDQLFNVYEMFRTGELHLLYLLIPLQILLFGIPAFIIARYKGQNLRYARIAALIPIINIVAIFYYLMIRKTYSPYTN